MPVILDIDGTLADNAHRAHLVEKRSPPNWDEFLSPAQVVKDVPIPKAKRALDHFRRLKYPLVFLTGRHEALRDTTMRWLLEHFEVDVTDETLLMRPRGNLLKAAEFKREQALAIRQDYAQAPLTFIDDDLSCASMYAEFGSFLHAPLCWEVLFTEAAPEEERS